MQLIQIVSLIANIYMYQNEVWIQTDIIPIYIYLCMNTVVISTTIFIYVGILKVITSLLLLIFFVFIRITEYLSVVKYTDRHLDGANAVCLAGGSRYHCGNLLSRGQDINDQICLSNGSITRDLDLYVQLIYASIALCRRLSDVNSPLWKFMILMEAFVWMAQATGAW